jgi:hypothetical protein
MARGKKSLLETSNLPIVTTDIEEGQIPYFLIDDEWGIACDERNEILVHKRIANRTIKNEKGDEDHIEQYIMWDSISYPSTFSSAIESYVNKKGKTEKSKLKKSTNYNDLIKIQNEIKLTIEKSLEFNGVNSNFLSSMSIIDERAKLEEEIKKLRETKEMIIKETDLLMELVKQKRAIIISNTEPKKHRDVKEEK